MRRKRRRIGINKSILGVTSIVLINLAGVSYAATLENSLTINNVITAGDLNPYFSQTTSVNNNVDTKLINSDEIRVNANMQNSDSAKIMYKVTDGGTVPIRLANVTNTSNDNGIELTVDSPDVSKDGTGTLSLKGIKPGKYNFRVEMLYKQWNK